MVGSMEVLEIAACAAELGAEHHASIAVTHSTRVLRRARAVQLAEIRAVVESGAYFADGHRSPAAWLCATTRESYGHCTMSISLATRIIEMPLVQAAFAAGDLAETALRLLTEAWAPAVADAFARDEAMLLGWATTLPVHDLKLVLDTWRMHTAPNREAVDAADQFDRRAVHLSSLLDGVGRLDGTLDPDGYLLLREAIRSLSQPGEDETRTAAHRRHDALIQMAKIVLATIDTVPGAVPGKKRRRPTVIATATARDLAAETGGGAIDTGSDRTVVPIDTVRRYACDCDLHRYLTDPAGHVIDYGRTRRLVSDTQFDLLIIRDHGCRWPGCRIGAAGCDAHHATHWLDGGTTEPDNLILLCWYHHHLLHEQHWSMQPLGAGHFTLHNPDRAERIMRPPLIGAAPPTPRPAPPA